MIGKPSVVVVLALLAIGAGARQAAAQPPISAEWTGAAPDPGWKNADNWSTTDWPGSFLHPEGWTVSINSPWSDDVSVSVGGFIANPNSPIHSVRTACGGNGQPPCTGFVNLIRSSFGSGLEVGTLTNDGNLYLAAAVDGQVVNNGYLEFDADIWGDVANHGTVDMDVASADNFTNSGAVTLNPFSELELAGNMTNDSSVQLFGGTLSADGPITNPAGASISGFGVMGSGTSIVNAGRIEAFGGTLSIGNFVPFTNTGSLKNNPGTSLQIAASTIDQSGEITVHAEGAVAVSADLTNKAGASITLLGGTLAAANIVNQPGATFTGFGGVTAEFLGARGSVTNEGLIELFGDSQIVGDVQNDAAATLEFRNGDLLIVGHTTNDGTIRSDNGNIFFEGGITNNGTLELAQPLADSPVQATSAGDLIFGTGAGLQIEIGGPADVSRLNVADGLGTATIDGALEVVFADGFEPDPGDRFPFMTYPSRTGAFDAVVTNATSAGLLFDVEYDDVLGRASLVVSGLAGDVNLDGIVDNDDLNLLLSGYGLPSGATRSYGDLDGDHDVDNEDLQALLATFGNTPDALIAGAAQPVPEPSTMLLLLAGLLGFAAKASHRSTAPGSHDRSR